MKKNLGFTVIELLLIVGIIAILVAIAFPVFGIIKEKSKTSACASNLKQLGLAIRLYADDNNGAYPYAGIYAGEQKAFFLEFPIIIAPYVKSTDVFFCPNGTLKYKPNSNDDENKSLAKNGNYSTNRKILLYSNGRNEPIKPIFASSIKAPASIYAIYDGSYCSMSCDDFMLCGVSRAYLPGSGDSNGKPFVQLEGNTETDKIDYMKGRHNKGINIAFVDGHVKYVKSKKAWEEINKSPSPWRPDDWK